jgi:hypothetical protein
LHLAPQHATFTCNVTRILSYSFFAPLSLSFSPRCPIPFAPFLLSFRPCALVASSLSLHF